MMKDEDKVMKIKIIFFGFLMTTILWASDTVVLANLEWQDNTETKSTKLNWHDAVVYCNKLTLVGKSDWRLPSIKELQSIVDMNQVNPAIKRKFRNIASDNDVWFTNAYWSKSLDISSFWSAWNIGFTDGQTYNSVKSDKKYVRCVRHRQ